MSKLGYAVNPVIFLIFVLSTQSHANNTCFEFYARKNPSDVIVQQLNISQKDGAAEKLVTFAGSGNLIEVSMTLSEYPDVLNRRSSNGATALIEASENGHTEVVKFLLSKPNIGVNITKLDSTNALMKAAAKNHLDIVKLLLAHPKIDPNFPDPEGLPAVALVAKTNTSLLLEFINHPKVRLNFQTSSGHHILEGLSLLPINERLVVFEQLAANQHFNAAFGEKSFIQELVPRSDEISENKRAMEVLEQLRHHPGFEIDRTGALGSFLNVAIKNENIEFVKYLLDIGKARITTNDFLEAFRSKERKTELFETLFLHENFNPTSSTLADLFVTAASSGFSSAIDSIMAHGNFDVNSQTGKDNRTLLLDLILTFRSSDQGKAHYIAAVKRILIHPRLKINMKINSIWSTHLRAALARGKRMTDYTMVNLLIEAPGIDLLQADEKGKTLWDDTASEAMANRWQANKLRQKYLGQHLRRTSSKNWPL